VTIPKRNKRRGKGFKAPPHNKAILEPYEIKSWNKHDPLGGIK
jgi:hypothetical protein